MAKGGKEINIRMVQELYEVYKNALRKYRPSNTEQELLFDHAFDFFHQLQKMVAKYMLEKQQVFKLKLKSHEARALVRFWHIIPLPETPYANTVIRQMIGEYHKKLVDLTTQRMLLE